MADRKLLTVVVEAMFECSQPFTSAEFIQELNKKGVTVTDEVLLMQLLTQDEALEQVGEDLYEINILGAIEKYTREGEGFH